MRNTVIDLYTITTLTNLHAGRGDSNYGIVDNEVQRDPIADYPAIFSSSLKGAFRQLLDDQVTQLMENAQNEKDEAKAKIIEELAKELKGHILFIFGNEVRNNGTIRPGKYIFHEARLVSLPVRSEKVPFLHGTTLGILDDLLSSYAAIAGITKEKFPGIKGLSKPTVSKGKPKASLAGDVDEYSADILDDGEKKFQKFFQDAHLLPNGDVAFFQEEDYKSVCERLPIIARNQLESGVSKNLFYEEVVPRQTRFAFMIERPVGYDKFHEHLEGLTFRVQIGGNASIGYGVCLINRIDFTKKQ